MQHGDLVIFLALEPFEPQTIENLKQTRAYKKLVSKQDDMLQRLKKKHKEVSSNRGCTSSRVRVLTRFAAELHVNVAGDLFSL